jgi:3,4-dihydroxy 2-butanone 4-phosphate synthase
MSLMLDKALNELSKGSMLLLHDSSGREDEVDMIIHASHIRPEHIRRMRKDGGGLICLAVGQDMAQRLKLPFMSDLMLEGAETVRNLIPDKTAYGDKPAFSLSVNHRDTFTGITDNDRALTIREFEDLNDAREMALKFYSPGHVHLLISRGIEARRGHTELSTELAKRAGLNEAMVLCEMMADDGNALSFHAATKYALKNNMMIIDGEAF